MDSGLHALKYLRYILSLKKFPVGASFLLKQGLGIQLSHVTTVENVSSYSNSADKMQNKVLRKFKETRKKSVQTPMPPRIQNKLNLFTAT